MAKSEPTFFVVADPKIIKTGIEIHNGNKHGTMAEALGVAEKLADDYASEFYVMKAVKVVRRKRPPVEVVDLE